MSDDGNGRHLSVGGLKLLIWYNWCNVSLVNAAGIYVSAHDDNIMSSNILLSIVRRREMALVR
jgi:hypothetical protein